jgi:hypothetical protein
MASSLARLSAASDEAEPLLDNVNPYVAGACVLAILLVLFLMTWAFRSVRTRH